MNETKEAVAKPHPPPTHEKKGWSLGALGVQGPLIGLVLLCIVGHEVIVVGFDGDVAGLKAVETGTLDATMTQKTQGMGKLALESALDLAAGKQVPKEQLQEAVLNDQGKRQAVYREPSVKGI